MRKTVRSPAAGLLLATSALAAGCSSGDGGLKSLVEDVTRRQAAQQETLLRQSAQLSDASRQLVASDAEARRELAEMQSELQRQFEAQRRGIDRQCAVLDEERREIARQRHRDPLTAAAIVQGVTLAVAALPLVICILLLGAAAGEPPDDVVNELLVQELTTEEPMLLPHRPPAPAELEHRAPALDGPDAPAADAESDAPAGPSPEA